MNQNLEVFEIHLDGMLVSGGIMPMKEYGEFLINSQDLITSLAERPLSLNSSPSANIRNDTELSVYANCSGSLKILLTSKQSKLEVDGDTPLTNAFRKLNKISNFEGNFSDLTVNEGLGKKQVSYYKRLVQSLSSLHLDMEVKRPIKDGEDELLCDFPVSKSYKVYRSITEKPETIENIREITGVIKALDLEKFIFKIEVVEGNRTEIITSDFNKRFEEFMVCNFNKEITVNLKNTTQNFIDKNVSSDYELIEVL